MNEILLSQGILILVFLLGTLFGARVSYYLRKNFYQEVDKNIKNKLASYEDLVSKTAQRQVVELGHVKDQLGNILTESLADIYKLNEDVIIVANNLKFLQMEIKNEHSTRLFLENEITKLKNIIKRQKRQDM